jgi:4-hydroxysphinganine ceramide fatty acyl 2-hydroxylase
MSEEEEVARQMEVTKTFLDASRPVAPEVEVPEESAPEESAPEESVPEVEVPEESAPEESAPEESVPEESVPENDPLAFLDASRPVAPQILFATDLTDEQYIQGVFHHPQWNVRDCAMFDEPLERLTRAPPAFLAKFWGRMIGPILALSFIVNGAATTGICVGIGMGVWPGIEYVFHRMFFHEFAKHLNNDPLRQAAHFVMHGMHHRFPKNLNHTTMPPIGVLPHIATISIVLSMLVGWWKTLPLLCGGIIGLVFYDTVHHLLHAPISLDDRFLTNVRRLMGPFLKNLQANHMRHHHRPNVLFGVTTPMFDHVCGTLKSGHSLKNE